MRPVYFALSILTAYIVGSVPTAYIFTKLLKGVDIREYFSGNVGATNVARVVGKGPAVLVFILDFLKGTFAVLIVPLLLQRVFGDLHVPGIFLGLAVIAGHVWPVFLKFKGGKGVATTAGVIAGLSPLIMVSGMVLWIIVFMPWRYVSLASLCAAVSLPIFAVLYGEDTGFIIFCAVLALAAIYFHRSNIRRLLSKTEHKLR